MGEPAARIPAARHPSLPAVDFIPHHQKPQVSKAGGDAGNRVAACGQVLPALRATASTQGRTLPVCESDFLPLEGVKEPAEQAKNEMRGPNHG